MKKLNFSFTTKLTFDNNVHSHSFALRCIPLENEGQKILSCDLDIKPFVSTCRTTDAFGNNVASGYIAKEHRFLDFEINGEAQTDCTAARGGFMPCYRYQSPLTRPLGELGEFAKKAGSECAAADTMEKVKYISDRLSEIFTYEKNSTDTKTDAAQAFMQKKGVCQDFSHIMLSVLRANGIPCRYIAGLACCDGETHSWIDVWDKDRWKGFDPTNNCEADDNYIILTQGRDFGDCAIDRGVMFGAYTRQLQLITSRVTEKFY